MSERRAGTIALGISSVVLAVITAGLLIATAAMTWLYVQRDSDGFLESRRVILSTDRYAIASDELEFEGVPDEWLPANLIGTFRVEAQSSTEPVFIGVAPSSDVDEFLDGVAHTRVSGIGSFFRVDYEEVDGAGAPDDPAAQDFWVTKAQGQGNQRIEWEAESGEWTIVLMNADASGGMEVATSMAIDNRWLPLAIVLTGIIALFTGGVALVTGRAAVRRSRRQKTETVDTPELSGIAS